MLPRGSRRFLTSTILLSIVLASYLGITLSWAQENRSNPSKDISAAMLADAKQTYENVCAACHGLDARGSERGPDIASRPEVVQKSDADLAQILSNGRTAAGMPSFFSFGVAKISALVAYLRILEGRGQGLVLPGDPEEGKVLFFGKAKCSECHTLAGLGGFFASDLTTYSGKLDANELRAKILNPDADLDPRRGLARVVLSNGTELTGAIRNESNFSIQLQTSDGTFHLLNKSDLRSQFYLGVSGMPRDYQSTLSPAELNDVISFVLRSISDAAHHASAKPDLGGDDN
jgi:putative heme-binding domain-containing protein